MPELLDALWPHAVMLLSAFGAATLLPFSSEVVLAAQIKAAVASPAALVATATVGNVAGSTLNWWLGRHLRHFEDRRWFPVKPVDMERATIRFRRFGVWSLLFAWIPVVGDPLTLIAGVLRIPLRQFIPLVAIGKGGRYVALAAALVS